MFERNIILSIPFLLLLSHLFIRMNSESDFYKIKDFRSNPMGIALKEDFFKVDMGIAAKSRILAFADFNNDK